MGLGDSLSKALAGLFIKDERANHPPIPQQPIPHDFEQQTKLWNSTQANLSSSANDAEFSNERIRREDLEAQITDSHFVFHSNRVHVITTPTYKIQLQLARVAGMAEITWIIRPEEFGKYQFKLFRSLEGFPSERIYDTEGMTEIATSYESNKVTLEYPYGQTVSHTAMVFPRVIGHSIEPMNAARFVCYMPTPAQVQAFRNEQDLYDKVFGSKKESLQKESPLEKIKLLKDHRQELEAAHTKALENGDKLQAAEIVGKLADVTRQIDSKMRQL